MDNKLSEDFNTWIALFLHIAILSIAMCVKNIDLLLEFLGSVGFPSLMFLFPGVGYILALRRYGKPADYRKCSVMFY